MSHERRDPEFPDRRVPCEALSLQHAATLLDVHEDTLKNWHKTGHITLIRTGPRLWRVPRSEISRLRKNSEERRSRP